MNVLNIDRFINRCSAIHDNKYDYSKSVYVDRKTKLKIICPIHGEFEQRPIQHIRGYGCISCSSNPPVDNKIAIEKFKSVHGDLYDYSLVKYINNETKVKIICRAHGIFEQTPSKHFNKQQRCFKCAGFNKSHNDIIDSFNKIHNNKYNYTLVKFKSIRDKIKIICTKHGEFKQSVNSHKRGIGCPTCKESKGERSIRQFLDSINIKYEFQKTFIDCRNINPLPFDFYLEEHNTCIEYDGKQHYEFNNFFGGINAFKEIKNRDTIKESYCNNNNIKLIRIKYNDVVSEKLKTELL